MLGQTISHYRILEQLGAGGMGVVYKAHDSRLDRAVALKFLPEKLAQEPQALERFRREARAASALNHPGICTIYDIGEQDGRAFIAMEFIDGETLRSHIHGQAASSRRNTEDSESRSRKLWTRRTPKESFTATSNPRIFSSRSADRQKCSISASPSLFPKECEGADSGGESSDSTSIVGIISGTPSYMSPEQVRGDDLDARTDIFSLGLVLYEMATGRQAFGGGTGGAIIEAVLTRPPARRAKHQSRYPAEAGSNHRQGAPQGSRPALSARGGNARDLQRLERDTDSGGALRRATQVPAPLSTTQCFILDRQARGAENTTAQQGTFRAPRVSKIIDSLAVLPFDNVSRDPEHEYLSDGISGSLINILADRPKTARDRAEHGISLQGARH